MTNESSKTESLPDVWPGLVEVAEAIGIESIRADLKDQQKMIAQADFWQKSQAAEIAKDLAHNQDLVKAYEVLVSEYDTIKQLEQSDPGEAGQLLPSFRRRLGQFKKNFVAKTDGPAAAAVVLTLTAGAGGTDAQDWVGILGRMYQRWAVANRAQVELLNQQPGEPAGFKSISYKIRRPPNIYGDIQTEAGIHRLIRRSPFNSRQLRQTSFARVEISPMLSAPAAAFALDDADLRYDYFRSSGPGGQSVNKTSSAVRITHKPTAMTVAIQSSRSQHQNKATARSILQARLMARAIKERAARLSDLKGPPPPIEWGSQIRTYTFDPYQLVKDHRSDLSTSNLKAVLDGDIGLFLEADKSSPGR